MLRLGVDVSDVSVLRVLWDAMWEVTMEMCFPEDNVKPECGRLCDFTPGWCFANQIDQWQLFDLISFENKTAEKRNIDALTDLISCKAAWEDYRWRGEIFTFLNLSSSRRWRLTRALCGYKARIQIRRIKLIEIWRIFFSVIKTFHRYLS